MTEPNKPLEQMSPQERLELGRSRYNEGKFDEAITLLQTIVPTEDSLTYTEAQLGLGLAYEFKGDINEAISAWLNIHREDNPKAYAWAQFRLGFAYEIQDRLDECISAWSNIDRKDNPEVYAKAQLNLGATYYAQGKLDQAIEAWSNIHREDDSEAYAKAQLNLGVAYKDQGNLDKAITAYSNIHRDDNPETYAKAQLNLGVAYKDQGNLDKAITAYSNIHRDDNPETYAKAQLNLGVAYYAQEDWEQAIAAWSNIHREDDSEAYTRAQLGLGAAYYAQEDWEQAIAAWSNIHREKADPEAYTRAQLGLGAAYYAQGKLDQAIAAWSNIHREKADPETYAQAQLGLGEIHKDKGNIKQAKDAYRNVQGPLYYRAQREYRILGCPPELINDLRSLAKNTDKVRESLQIISDFESKVAHYSRASTAFSLFGDDKNPSNFRLSTIHGVNDPTEGLVLGKYWDQQGIPETIHTNNTATFISCFTFNHDSLNQFRLYGKENGQEATGVSLVFKKEFFSDQTDTLEFIAGPSTDLSSKSEHIKLNETGKMENDNKKPLIGKSTLYRCIYLDPETGYWNLAQRDKSTFYREHNENEDTDAKEKWEDYYELISEIEEDVETHLFNEENNEEEDVETHLLNKENNDDNSVSNENNKMKSISQILNSIFTDKNHSYNKCDKDGKQKILEAIRFILLPLQYLVKHIAFQEEQECRIMYITQFRDEKVHSNREEQKMYVEYEEPVLPHIDKIWLSPGAAKDQDFFRILLDKEDNDNKVRISQNPFRNKE